MKPVAWIGKDELQFGFTDTRVTNEKESWDDIPLYTHPAKTLTDEEINKIYLEKYDGHMGFLSPDEVRDFARAILRKAQND